MHSVAMCHLYVYITKFVFTFIQRPKNQKFASTFCKRAFWLLHKVLAILSQQEQNQISKSLIWKKSVIKNCPDSGISSLKICAAWWFHTTLSTELAPGYTNVILIWKGNNRWRDQLMCFKQHFKVFMQKQQKKFKQNFKGARET